MKIVWIAALKRHGKVVLDTFSEARETRKEYLGCYDLPWYFGIIYPCIYSSRKLEKMKEFGGF